MTEAEDSCSWECLGKRLMRRKDKIWALLRYSSHWTLVHQMKWRCLPSQLVPVFPIFTVQPWATQAPDVGACLACSGAAHQHVWRVRTEAGRYQDVTLVSTRALRAMWVFFWQQNLARKGRQLLFFGHFISRMSKKSPIVFCMFSWPWLLKC